MVGRGAVVVKGAASVLDISRLAVGSPVTINDSTEDLASLAVADLTRIRPIDDLLSVPVDLPVLLALCKNKKATQKSCCCCCCIASVRL